MFFTQMYLKEITQNKLINFLSYNYSIMIDLDFFKRLQNKNILHPLILLSCQTS